VITRRQKSINAMNGLSFGIGADLKEFVIIGVAHDRHLRERILALFRICDKLDFPA